MREHDGNASHEEPDHIHQQGETTGGRFTVDNLLSERPQGYLCQFQRLKSERDTNDGNHQGDTAYNIFDGHKNSTKNKPDDIPDCSHLIAITSISTNAFLGSVFTAKVERAGKVPLN